MRPRRKASGISIPIVCSHIRIRLPPIINKPQHFSGLSTKNYLTFHSNNSLMRGFPACRWLFHRNPVSFHLTVPLSSRATSRRRGREEREAFLLLYHLGLCTSQGISRRTKFRPGNQKNRAQARQSNRDH